MKPHIFSLINAAALIGLSLWGFYGSETPSNTALIPAFVGAILIALNPGVRKENKTISIIVFAISIVLLGALIKPFMGAMDREDNGAMIRVIWMIVTTILAIAAFVNYYLELKKGK